MTYLTGIVFTFIIIGIYNKFLAKTYTISLGLSLIISLFSWFAILTLIVLISGLILFALFLKISSMNLFKKYNYLYTKGIKNGWKCT